MPIQSEFIFNHSTTCCSVYLEFCLYVNFLGLELPWYRCDRTSGVSYFQERGLEQLEYVGFPVAELGPSISIYHNTGPGPNSYWNDIGEYKFTSLCG